MSCPTCLHLLQRHLDGDAAPAALDEHLRSCPACAAGSDVARLLDGLALLRAPTPPAHLANRITARLLREPRRPPGVHRGRALAALAAAAALLLAVGLWAWRPGPSGVPPEEHVQADRSAPAVPVEPLRESVSRGATAVVALTSFTATETVGQTTSLLPPVPPMPLDGLPMPEAVEAPLPPLHEAGAGLKAGLTPVADSARRAVGLFLRDLPLGLPAAENNPG